MSERQWKRLDAVERVRRGALTNGEAAAVVGLSERQMRRLRRRVAEQGRAGAVHGNRGRAPSHRLAPAIRERIVELRRTRYAGFNDQHFTEKLAESEQIVMSRATVRRVLRAAGIVSPRRRRAPRHRRRRERKAQTGLMVLWDGSRHDWLEGRGPLLCLLGAVDDASGELLPGAHFVEQECAAGYLRVLKVIASDKGLPWSAYMDQHSSLKRNDDYWTLQEELRGDQDPPRSAAHWRPWRSRRSTHCRRRPRGAWSACGARFRTGWYRNCALKEPARWPRPTRYWSASELITTAASRSRGRSGAGLAKAAARNRSGAGLQLGYQATVLNDNTVRLGGVVIDIPPGPRQRGYAHARVEVRQLLDGSWRVYYDDRLIATAAPSNGAELRALKARRRWAGRATGPALFGQLTAGPPADPLASS